MDRSYFILTLDDDSTMRALYTIAFRNLPVRLLMAQDEGEAQKAMERETVDLFLVDYRLGNDNGIEVAERILEKVGSKMPIVAVTAEAGDVLQKYVESGRCSGVMLKPISLGTFGTDILKYVNASSVRVDGSAASKGAAVRSDNLALDFLRNALAKAHDLSLRPNSDLLHDNMLAQVAHQWAGASGIGHLPEVETEARELERLARSHYVERIPDMRRLLSEITGKFAIAASSIGAEQ